MDRDRVNIGGMRATLRPQLIQAGYLFRQIKREFTQDRCTREANAMAYRTLFSSVPVLAVFLSVFTMFSDFFAFRENIFNIVYSFLVPAAGDVVREYMMQFAEKTKTLGAVSFIGTVIVALYLFWAIERSFNTIWDIDLKRGFVRNFTAFTALLLWIPVFIGLSFYLTGKLHFLVSNIFGKVELTLPGFITLRFLPVFFSFLGITTVYLVVPNTRVNMAAAAVGGLVAAAGWELVKVGFNIYVARAVSYSKVYGSLAVIPVFIIGLYLLWLVVFIGLEITYVFHSYRYHEIWDEKEWSGLKPYLAVGVMLELGRRFHDGEKNAVVAELSQTFRVAIPTLLEVLKNLQKSGLVVRVDEDTFFLARSLNLITVQDVIAAGVEEVNAVERMSGNFRSVVKGLPESVVSELERIFSDVAMDYRRTLGAATLADLLDKRVNEDMGSVAAASISG